MNLNKNDHDFSAEEREKFTALSRQCQPPPALETRIISTLKSKGLIRMATTQRNFAAPRLTVAFAAVVLLALGFSLGKWQSRTLQPDPNLQTFIMLLHEAGTVEAHEADKVSEYSKWAHTIAQAGQLVDGEKLRYDGRLLRRVDEKLEVLEFAPHEDAEHVGGYFLIQARDYEEAVQIARSCPHLKYGGVVELRQIDKT